MYRKSKKEFKKAIEAAMWPYLDRLATKIDAIYVRKGVLKRKTERMKQMDRKKCEENKKKNAITEALKILKAELHDVTEAQQNNDHYCIDVEAIYDVVQLLNGEKKEGTKNTECPRCGSLSIARERRINGSTKCCSCGLTLTHKQWDDAVIQKASRRVLSV
jgi:hypothetical protein